MHRFLGFPQPPHGRTHRFLADGMTVTCRLHHCQGSSRVHVGPLQADLATVRDAMEATDAALARKEQEAAYMVDGEM